MPLVAAMLKVSQKNVTHGHFKFVLDGVESAVYHWCCFVVGLVKGTDVRSAKHGVLEEYHVLYVRALVGPANTMYPMCRIINRSLDI